MIQPTPQKEVEQWSEDAQRSYWKGFDEGCRMAFDFVGPAAKCPDDIQFVSRFTPPAID